MTKIQINQFNQVNKYWKKVFYNIGDKVYLFTKNISTDQPSKKLDLKIIDSFNVIRKKSISIEL